MWTRLVLLAGVATISLLGSTARAACERPWVFFDLGNTLVDTRSSDGMRYMPGAVEYLDGIRAAGFRVGLITNIPQTWGANYEEKRARLEREIAATWIDAKPFDWTRFDAVLLPDTDAARKPAPALFEEALQVAGECPTVYEGEDAGEIRAAQATGMPAMQLPATTSSFFPSVDVLQNPSRRLTRR